MSQKYNFEFFYDSALLIDPIMRLKFAFFSSPEFKFLRGSKYISRHSAPYPLAKLTHDTYLLIG